MSQSEPAGVSLYEYDKLNTNSVFRRLVTDVYGRNLLDWRLEDEGPEEKWHWILT